MQVWLDLLYWFAAAIASFLTLVILIKATKLELGSLGDLFAVATAMVVLSTGVVRTFSDWNLALCILAGVIAVPDSGSG